MSVCFSQKTELGLPFVIDVANVLQSTYGMSRSSLFFQENIDEGSRDDWRLQWMQAAVQATVVACIVTKKYCESEPCCTEYASACSDKKELKVLLEKIDREWVNETIVKAEGNKGKVLMDLMIGAQMIQAHSKKRVDAVREVAKHIHDRVSASTGGGATLGSGTLGFVPRSKAGQESARKFV